MAGKLTEEQKAEIVRRYEAGEAMRSLQRVFGVANRTVRKLLSEEGVRIRTISEANFARSAIETLPVSRDALWMAYAGPGSGYPSLHELGRRWDVSPRTVRNRLAHLGIRVRSRSQQASIDVRLGRRQRPQPRTFPGAWKEGQGGNCWSKLNRAARRRCVERRAAARRRGQHTPCYWCGDHVWRMPCQMKGDRRAYCDRSCQGKGIAWARTRWEQPRPLIMDRLRELMRLPNGIRLLHPTYEQLEKAAGTIGAAEPEILAVMLEGRN